ncbi:hypothetical protein [Pedobacter metabolipauper]|uniref:Uncharacterized protein n=1 Tax=Pedobacter metabolipauper TaxID=425513 RepID=A0A4V3D1J4_9SPHI|nr:hypothetical protein [Pedobacter metabolipauper]TDQ11423.1 hypothetical protein ATK78_0545 [Pedobacter metabolipauper]
MYFQLKQQTRRIVGILWYNNCNINKINEREDQPMAKEIKAIKCPQCSSTSKTEIKPEIYRCNNCQTEYYLDNDDITVNYNHNHNSNTTKPILNPGQTKNLITGIVIFVVAMVLLSVLISVFSVSQNDGSVVSETEQTEQKEKVQIPYAEMNIASFVFSQPATGDPIVMYITHRDYKDSLDVQKTGIYFAFHNPVKKKLIKEIKLGDEIKTRDFKIRTFSDGNVYLLGDSKLYRLEKDGLKVIEAGRNYFSAQPKFEVGIASVYFDSKEHGDALVINTNDGKKYYYYPLIQKVYKSTTDDRARAEWGFKNLLPVGKKKVYHLFSEESSDFPEEKIQLLKVTYLDNGPGPKKILDRMSWFRDYYAAGGNGFYSSNDPYVKSLFGVYNEASCRILSAKDLTPDRDYFYAKIAYEDDNSLLIQMKGDASPEKNYKLQKINIQNGKIEWTADLPACCLLENLVKFKDGYIGSLNKNEYTQFDLNGKVTGKYTVKLLE